MRDIDQAYRTAMIDEYAALKSSGRDEEAEHVATVLRERYGHEVEAKPAKQREPEKAPERVDVAPPPENTAEPQPRRRGPAKKTAASQPKE